MFSEDSNNNSSREMYPILKIGMVWNICFLLLFSTYFTNADDSKITAGINETETRTLSNLVNKNNNVTVVKPSNTVASEVGNVSITKHEPSVSSGVDTTDETHLSREGKKEPDPPDNSINEKPNDKSQIDETHKSREGNEQNSSVPVSHALDDKNFSSINVTDTSKNDNSKTSVKDLDLLMHEMSGKNDNKLSVPKKEPKDSQEISSTAASKPQVSIKSSNGTTNQQTNGTATINSQAIDKTSVKNQTVERPRKPLYTEASDDDFAPSHFVSGNKADGSKKTDSVPSLESIGKQKSKSADYVVPIIGIIFSVPLVAVIISILYKRTAEWWHHRHYRRMDFLIEGMYNN